MRRRDVSKQDLVDHSAITPHTHSPLSIRPPRGFDDLAPPCRTQGCLLTRPFGRIFSFGYAYTTLSTFFLTFTHQRDERDSAFRRILPGFLRRGFRSIVLGAHAVILRTRLCCSILASYLCFFPFYGGSSLGRVLRFYLSFFTFLGRVLAFSLRFYLGFLPLYAILAFTLASYLLRGIYVGGWVV